TVPAGVSEATVDLYGAQGGGGPPALFPPGLGGRATATIGVTPGGSIQVNVGGQGSPIGSGGSGGFNGGGTATGSSPAGGGGGGGWYGGGGGLNGGGGGGGSGHGPLGTVFETGARSGNGLVTVTYTAAPTSKDQCKNNGWKAFPQFKSQGQCEKS